MYRTIDLFAGIGGIRRGYEMTGQFQNVLSAEIDKYACETYKHLYGDDPYNDVTSEVFKQKVENTQYDVLLAGFPCQAFSRAGRQEGFHDSTRGTLFFDVADIIKRTMPKAFMLENVDNLLSHNGGRTFKTILGTLTVDLPYKVIGVTAENGIIKFDSKDFLRNTRNFGLPQNRPRVYIMGFNKEYFEDKITKITDFRTPTKRSAAPIYSGLTELIEFGCTPSYYVAEGYLQTLERHRSHHQSVGNGFGYVVLNQPGKEQNYSNALLATGGSGKERNLIYDPQDGIAGMMVGAKKTPLSDRCIRHMTPREWGKLQGFINYAFMDKNGNDGFSFPASVSNAQQYKQFGNSVSIPVIEEMAKFMLKCFDCMDND